MSNEEFPEQDLKAVRAWESSINAIKSKTTELSNEIENLKRQLAELNSQLHEVRRYCSHPPEHMIHKPRACAEDDSNGTCGVCGAEL